MVDAPRPQKIEPSLTEEQIRKIKVAWNYIGWSDFVPQMRYELDEHPRISPQYLCSLDVERDIDVSLVANADFTEPLLRIHRKRCVQALDKVRNAKKMVRVAGENPATRMRWSEYFAILRRSEIVVSPWGWEPVTLRDIEALLAGAILVKPDTSFLETWPEVPHIACQPDFSNLDNVIRKVLGWSPDERRSWRKKGMMGIVESVSSIGFRLSNLLHAIGDSYG
jgi:hypothetical protein